jgi:hypothetical protein
MRAHHEDDVLVINRFVLTRSPSIDIAYSTHTIIIIIIIIVIFKFLITFDETTVTNGAWTTISAAPIEWCAHFAPHAHLILHPLRLILINIEPMP